MNYALIGLNVLVFLGMLAGGGDAQQQQETILRWAYIPARGGVLTLFTSLFLHGGWMHLLGNMLFLWIFGDNVEARLGSLGYLVAYLALGAVATLVYGLSAADSAVPLIGASGAISAVQGLYWIACPRHRVKLFVWVFVIFVWIVRINARWVMAVWFIMNDLFPVLVGHGPIGDGVAHRAHLGGFGAGILLMLLLRPFLHSLQGAEDREFGRTAKYRGGRTERYVRKRNRDPYRRRSARPK